MPQPQNSHMTPSREEIKAHAYERLKEELNLAQQVIWDFIQFSLAS